jgi:hypothetical protein
VDELAEELRAAPNVRAYRLRLADPPAEPPGLTLAELRVRLAARHRELCGLHDRVRVAAGVEELERVADELDAIELARRARPRDVDPAKLHPAQLDVHDVLAQQR